MPTSKRDWILLTLAKAPLDRIHLMKALFLFWIRSGKNIPDYFTFKPYLYGPYSLPIYSELNNLKNVGLIVQPPHSIHQWANYYLTERGQVIAEEARKLANPDRLSLLEQVIQEVSQLGFHDLLKKVYSEAPEFATKSILRGLYE